jgi:hypothetical protein
VVAVSKFAGPEWQTPSHTVCFLLFFVESFLLLWHKPVKFLLSLLGAPIVLFLRLAGYSANMSDKYVTDIAIWANHPPSDLLPIIERDPIDAADMVIWTLTEHLWYLPRYRIGVVTKLAPLLCRKWSFRYGSGISPLQSANLATSTP